MNQEKIEEGLTQFPICEYAFINIADITFLDQVRYICKTECPQYGKSWSCPPAVGTVEECKKRCSQYTGGFIFTTIAEVNDITSTTSEAMREAAKALESLRRRSQELVTLIEEMKNA